MLFILSMVSCSSKKEILYFQDIDMTALDDVSTVFQNPKVAVSDILNIRISTEDPESAIPFQFQTADGGSIRTTSGSLLKLYGYLVDKEGYINYPFLGEIPVISKTTKEIEKDLERRLSVYIKDPTVSVRIVNNKITVLGSVKSPGTYTLDEETLTLPQALGLAGDLSIHGNRTDVLIMRYQGDRRVIKHIDLTKSDWMNGPFYYMKQNDVVYVKPNNPQIKTAGYIGSVGTVLSVFSILLSMGLLLFK
ncbi:MAG TPA: polysaccharide biosynthesis/export family protein [Flavobacteriaceae bacterium]|nr:polysaccharide biosynthesis/export family protein [Flavobacteriaceae bacterium]